MDHLAQSDTLTLLHLFDVAGFPDPMDGGFSRAVEPEDGETPLAGTLAGQLPCSP